MTYRYVRDNCPDVLHFLVQAIKTFTAEIRYAFSYEWNPPHFLHVPQVRKKFHCCFFLLLFSRSVRLSHGCYRKHVNHDLFTWRIYHNLYILLDNTLSSFHSAHITHNYYFECLISLHNSRDLYCVKNLYTPLAGLWVGLWGIYVMSKSIFRGYLGNKSTKYFRFLCSFTNTSRKTGPQDPLKLENYKVRL